MLHLGGAVTIVGFIVYIFPVMAIISFINDYVSGFYLSLPVVILGLADFVILKLTVKSFYNKTIAFFDEEKGTYKRIMEELKTQRGEFKENKTYVQ